MTPGLLALQFLLRAALIGVAGYWICQSADRIARATGLTGGWIGLALLATVTSLPELASGISAVTVMDAPTWPSAMRWAPACSTWCFWW